MAAVASLHETGFAVKRAISRLQEMQTKEYLDNCLEIRENMRKERVRREELLGKEEHANKGNFFANDTSKREASA